MLFLGLCFKIAAKGLQGFNPFYHILLISFPLNNYIDLIYP